LPFQEETMVPVMPFWAVQRQVKAEEVSPDTLLLKAPQAPVCEIGIRPAGEGPGCKAVLYRLPDAEGEKALLAESEPVDSQEAAWSVAFELYRQHVVV
jgi:hypothetical protein